MDVSDEHKEDQEYFAAIRQELEGGGYEALMYDLQHEDIEAFNPRVIPVTSAGLDMKLKSASGVIRWLYEMLKGGYKLETRHRLEVPIEIPVTGGELVKDVVYENYLAFCGHIDHTRPDTRSQFWKILKQANLGLSDVRASKGDRPRSVAFPLLAEARAAFERLVKQPVDWDE